MSNVSKIRMLPGSHFHLVKEALFGIYHYNGALGEFHTQKGKKKKNHRWLPESTELLSALSCLTCGRIVFLFYCTEFRIEYTYEQTICTLINGSFMGLLRKMSAQKRNIKARGLLEDLQVHRRKLLGKVKRETHTHTQNTVHPFDLQTMTAFFPRQVSRMLP